MKKIFLVFLMVVMEVSATPGSGDYYTYIPIDLNSTLNGKSRDYHEYRYYTFDINETTVVKAILNGEAEYPDYYETSDCAFALGRWDDDGYVLDWYGSMHGDYSYVTRKLQKGHYEISLFGHNCKYSLELKTKGMPHFDPIELDGDSIEDAWTLQSNISWEKPNSYAHFYTFTLDNAQSINLDLVSDIDNILYLYNEEGKQIAQDSDKGIGNNAFITTYLKAGTYTIEATTENSGKIGDFEIYLRSGATVKPLKINSVTNGKWTKDSALSPNQHNSYSDYYTFTLTEAKSLYLELISNANGVVHIFDEKGNNLYHENSVKSNKMALNLTAGTYSIDITTLNSYTTGKYELHLTTDFSDIAKPIKPTDTIEDTNNNQSIVQYQRVKHEYHSKYFEYKVKYYTFSLDTDDKVYLSGDLRGRILNSNGIPMTVNGNIGTTYFSAADWDGFNKVFQLKKGTYFIELDDTSTDSKFNLFTKNYIIPYSWLPAIYSILN